MSQQKERWISEISKAREREIKKIKSASKAVSAVFTQKVVIPDDPYNSVIYIKPEADAQEAIRKFKARQTSVMPVLETASIGMNSKTEAAVIDPVVKEKEK